MNPEKSLRRVCLFTAIVFFCNSIGPLPPLRAAESAVVSFKDVHSLSLPEDTGSLQEVFAGSAPETIIIVQDAHAIPEAQKSIRRIICHFEETSGLSLVGLEGAASALDTRFLGSFPQREHLEELFQDYYEKGELSGAVAAAVLGSGRSEYHGIEDWGLYEKGLSLYLAALDDEESLLKAISEKRGRLEKEKASVFSPALLEADGIIQDFYEERLNLADFLTKLSVYREPAEGSDLALMLGRLRQSGGQNSIETEVKRIAREVEQGLKAAGKNPLLQAESVMFYQKLQQFNVSQLPPESFALYLRELSPRLGLKVSASAELSGRAREQRTIDEIEGTEFFENLEAFIHSVKNGLIQSEEARRLDRKFSDVRLAGKTARMELSRKEWSEVKKRTGEISGGDFRLDLSGRIRFYENAEQRDEVFLEKLTGLMKEKKQTLALMIAGGFHAQGLSEHLKAKGISHILVTPKINVLPEENHYRNHMRGEVSWEKYFRDEKGRINLYDAFVRASRDELLRRSDEAPGVVLKNWRDALIRGLADAGRIDEASRYTSFIDEKAGGERGGGEDRLRKVDDFINGMRRLEAAGQISPQTILQLIRPSGISAGSTAAAIQAPDDTLTSSLVALGFRSELRELGRDPAVIRSAAAADIETLKENHARDVAALKGRAETLLAEGIPADAAFQAEYSRVIENTITSTLNAFDRKFGLKNQLAAFVLGSLARRTSPYGTDIDMFFIASPKEDGISRVVEVLTEALKEIIPEGVDFPAAPARTQAPVYFPDIDRLRKDLADMEGISLYSLLDRKFVFGDEGTSAALDALLREEDYGKFIGDWTIVRSEDGTDIGDSQIAEGINAALDRFTTSRRTAKPLSHLYRLVRKRTGLRLSARQLKGLLSGRITPESMAERDNHLFNYLQEQAEASRSYVLPGTVVPDGAVSGFEPKKGPGALRTIQVIGYIGRIQYRDEEQVSNWSWKTGSTEALFTMLSAVSGKEFLNSLEAEDLVNAEKFFIRLRSAMNLAAEKAGMKDAVDIYNLELETETARLMGIPVTAVRQQLVRHQAAVLKVADRIISETDFRSDLRDVPSAESVFGTAFRKYLTVTNPASPPAGHSRLFEPHMLRRSLAQVPDFIRNDLLDGTDGPPGIVYARYILPTKVSGSGVDFIPLAYSSFDFSDNLTRRRYIAMELALYDFPNSLGFSVKEMKELYLFPSVQLRQLLASGRTVSESTNRVVETYRKNREIALAAKVALIPDDVFLDVGVLHETFEFLWHLLPDKFHDEWKNIYPMKDNPDTGSIYPRLLLYAGEDAEQFAAESFSDRAALHYDGVAGAFMSDSGYQKSAAEEKFFSGVEAYFRGKLHSGKRIHEITEDIAARFAPAAGDGRSELRAEGETGDAAGEAESYGVLRVVTTLFVMAMKGDSIRINVLHMGAGGILTPEASYSFQGPEEITVGFEDARTISVDRPYFSRDHFALRYDIQSKKWQVRDRGSMNGVDFYGKHIGGDGTTRTPSDWQTFDEMEAFKAALAEVPVNDLRSTLYWGLQVPPEANPASYAHGKMAETLADFRGIEARWKSDRTFLELVKQQGFDKAYKDQGLLAIYSPGIGDQYVNIGTGTVRTITSMQENFAGVSIQPFGLAGRTVQVPTDELMTTVRDYSKSGIFEKTVRKRHPDTLWFTGTEEERVQAVIDILTEHPLGLVTMHDAVKGFKTEVTARQNMQSTVFKSLYDLFRLKDVDGVLARIAKALEETEAYRVLTEVPEDLAVPQTPQLSPAEEFAAKLDELEQSPEIPIVIDLTALQVRDLTRINEDVLKGAAARSASLDQLMNRLPADALEDADPVPLAKAGRLRGLKALIDLELERRAINEALGPAHEYLRREITKLVSAFGAEIFVYGVLFTRDGEIRVRVMFNSAQGQENDQRRRMRLAETEIRRLTGFASRQPLSTEDKNKLNAMITVANSMRSEMRGAGGQEEFPSIEYDAVLTRTEETLDAVEELLASGVDWTDFSRDLEAGLPVFYYARDQLLNEVGDEFLSGRYEDRFQHLLARIDAIEQETARFAPVQERTFQPSLREEEAEGQTDFFTLFDNELNIIEDEIGQSQFAWLGSREITSLLQALSRLEMLEGDVKTALEEWNAESIETADRLITRISINRREILATLNEVRQESRSEMRSPGLPPEFGNSSNLFKLGGTRKTGQRYIRFVEDVLVPFSRVPVIAGVRRIPFALGALALAVRQIDLQDEGAGYRDQSGGIAEMLPYMIEYYDAEKKEYFPISRFDSYAAPFSPNEPIFVGRATLNAGILKESDMDVDLAVLPVDLERPDSGQEQNERRIALYKMHPERDGIFLPKDLFTTHVSRHMFIPDKDSIVEDHRDDPADFVGEEYIRPGHAELEIVDTELGPALKLTDRGSMNGTHLLKSVVNAALEIPEGSVIAQIENQEQEISGNTVNTLILGSQQAVQVEPGESFIFQAKFPFMLRIADQNGAEKMSLRLEIVDGELVMADTREPWEKAKLRLPQKYLPLPFEIESRGAKLSKRKIVLLVTNTATGNIAEDTAKFGYIPFLTVQSLGPALRSELRELEKSLLDQITKDVDGGIPRDQAFQNARSAYMSRLAGISDLIRAIRNDLDAAAKPAKDYPDALLASAERIFVEVKDQVIPAVEESTLIDKADKEPFFAGLLADIRQVQTDHPEAYLKIQSARGFLIRLEATAATPFMVNKIQDSTVGVPETVSVPLVFTEETKQGPVVEGVQEGLMAQQTEWMINGQTSTLGFPVIFRIAYVLGEFASNRTDHEFPKMDNGLGTISAIVQPEQAIFVMRDNAPFFYVEAKLYSYTSPFSAQETQKAVSEKISAADASRAKEGKRAGGMGFMILQDLVNLPGEDQKGTSITMTRKKDGETGNDLYIKFEYDKVQNWLDIEGKRRDVENMLQAFEDYFTEDAMKKIRELEWAAPLSIIIRETRERLEANRDNQEVIVRAKAVLEALKLIDRIQSILAKPKYEAGEKEIITRLRGAIVADPFSEESINGGSFLSELTKHHTTISRALGSLKAKTGYDEETGAPKAGEKTKYEEPVFIQFMEVNPLVLNGFRFSEAVREAGAVTPVDIAALIRAYFPDGKDTQFVDAYPPGTDLTADGRPAPAGVAAKHHTDPSSQLISELAVKTGRQFLVAGEAATLPEIETRSELRTDSGAIDFLTAADIAPSIFDALVNEEAGTTAAELSRAAEALASQADMRGELLIQLSALKDEALKRTDFFAYLQAKGISRQVYVDQLNLEISVLMEKIRQLRAADLAVGFVASRENVENAAFMSAFIRTLKDKGVKYVVVTGESDTTAAEKLRENGFKVILPQERNKEILLPSMQRYTGMLTQVSLSGEQASLFENAVYVGRSISGNDLDSETARYMTTLQTAVSLIIASEATDAVKLKEMLGNPAALLQKLYPEYDSPMIEGGPNGLQISTVAIQAYLEWRASEAMKASA